ncbi:MAG: GTPase HflX, partial [Planctomycetota bacterium]|nr:GTPase HflX [Planctomycetota bacterium]
MSEIQREQISVAAERAVLVAVHLPGRYVDASDPFSELRALAQTAGAEVVGELIQNRRLPSGKTYLGKGKTQELAGLVGTTAASLVIFD